MKVHSDGDMEDVNEGQPSLGGGHNTPNETDKAHPQLPNADSVSTLELQQQL